MVEWIGNGCGWEGIFCPGAILSCRVPIPIAKCSVPDSIPRDSCPFSTHGPREATFIHMLAQRSPHHRAMQGNLRSIKTLQSLTLCSVLFSTASFWHSHQVLEVWEPQSPGSTGLFPLFAVSTWPMSTLLISLQGLSS